MSLKSPLVPLALIVLSFGQLVLAGRGVTKTVAENLRNPRASTFLRLVDLVQWSPESARVHELAFTRPESGPAFFGDGARLRVQIWSKGRTRILVLRKPGSDPSRWQALLDVLRGRGRLQIVADRRWVDLGPLPSDGSPLTAQVAGLLPGPYGFAELKTPADPFFESIRVAHGSTPATVRVFLRYRITVPAPVVWRETLARFFFFISISRVLQAAGLIALVLLFAGWRFLGTEKTAAAVCCLIPSVVLLHAVCLPPLQGADETSHGATIEALLFRGMPVREGDPYPASLSRAGSWLEQDRVQYQPEEPLPLDGPETRVRLASRLGGHLEAQAKEKDVELPAASVQGVDTRSPLFFRPFQPLGPILRPLPFIERISAYRVLSALSGLILFCAGVLLLQRAGLAAGVVLAYGVVWLVPYMIFTVASISNYAAAIGLGSLLAACALVLILSEKRREKGTAAGLLLAGSWLGIPVWPDFVLLAPVATVVVAIGAILSATKNLSPGHRRSWRTASLAFGAAFLLTSAGLLFRIKAGNIGTRMPLEMPRHFDRSVLWMIVVTVVPTVIGGLLAFGVLRLSRLPADRQRRLLRGASIAAVTTALLGFFLTPWTSIPYETDRYWFSKLVREGIKVALSNSFSWDQDVLFWKFSLGAGGWHDVFLPDALYALSRWLFVVVIVTFPLLAARVMYKRPWHMVALLLVSGVAASFCVATLTLRYLQPGNPWGRFMLPWLPLLVAPLLVIASEELKRPNSDTALRIGALLSLWLTFAPTGGRYVLGLY